MISVFLPLLINCFLAWVGTGQYQQPRLNSCGPLLSWLRKVYLWEYKQFQHARESNWVKESDELGEGNWQMQYMESPKWEGGKAPNERKGKPKLEEDAFSLRRGKQMADQKRKKYSWKMPKMECPNERRGKPKWEEGRKAAAQPHPVDLC